MVTVKLLDNAFAHAASLGSGDLMVPPSLIRFDRSPPPLNYDGLLLATDDNITDLLSYPNATKIAWLLEPPEVNPVGYSIVNSNLTAFEHVLTHDAQLLERGAPFRFYPFGGCWIRPEDWAIYPKKSGVSMIASTKTITPGHHFRQEVVAGIGGKIEEVYGRGRRPLEYKLDALADFRFHIVIENGKKDFWFTEKLIDCFATGTIPIYWGCPSIAHFFDGRGVIAFDGVEELSAILDILNTRGPEIYESLRPAIERNFELFRDYALPEDWLYSNFLRDIIPSA